MPANKSEIEEAINEGVKFIFETNITKISKTNNRLVATLNEKDEGECDRIILAIGNEANKNIFEDYIEFDEYNLVKVDENNMTNVKNIYAGGDLIQNKNTVAYAVKSGITVAQDIIKNINKLHK
jgi:glutamate synthase (NADPH/NADH) small chain